MTASSASSAPAAGLSAPAAGLAETAARPITIDRVDWFDQGAVAQRAAMDEEMTALYAERSASSSPAVVARMAEVLTVDPADIIVTLVARDGAEVVGHTALRPFGDALEIKKVFVARSHRGRGVAKRLLAEAENIARQRDATALVLQTGGLQFDAIALYQRVGYRRFPNFRSYEVIPGSICFEKRIA